MRETGILSIVRCEHTLQVRYASFNPYDLDRLPYTCPTESALVTMLHQWGIDAWSLQQAVAALRKGEVAVVSVVLSEAQLQTYFSPQRPVCFGKDAEGVRGQGDSSLVPVPGRDVRRTRAKASI
jgi:hypothetical protein